MALSYMQRAKAKDMLAKKVRKQIGGDMVWRNKYTRAEVAKSVGVCTATIYKLISET